MKMKMLNAAAVVALSVLAGVASAAEPTKTGDIGSANGKSVHCSVTTTRLDLKEIAIRSDIDAGNMLLDMDPRSNHGFLKTTIDVGGNEQINLFMNFDPTGSLANRGPLLSMTATLFRVDSAGHTVVLSQNDSSSDQQAYLANEKYIGSNSFLTNVEILTLGLNQKNAQSSEYDPRSAYGLLKAGLVPNGTLVEAQVFCSMRIDK